MELKSFSYDKTYLRHWGHSPGRRARRSYRGILSYCADFRRSCLGCVWAVSWRQSLDGAVPWGEPHIWAPLGAAGQTRAGLLCRRESPLLVPQRRFEAVLPLQSCCHALAPAIEANSFVSNFWTFGPVTLQVSTPQQRFQISEVLSLPCFVLSCWLGWRRQTALSCSLLALSWEISTC